jgi:hypothetical protein
MSGGGAGARGYFLQAIAAVLKSLEDHDWIEVTLEPTNDEFNHKVDIFWHYPQGRKKVAQVKSTEHIFGKTEIINLLKKVTTAYSTAEEYQFILIGDCNQSVSELIVAIDNANEDFFSDINELKPFKNKINIYRFNLDYDTLEAQIHYALHGLMSKHSPVTMENVSTKMHTIVYNFQKFVCKPITRKELDMWLKSYSELSQLDEHTLKTFSLGQIERYYSSSNLGKKEELIESCRQLLKKGKWQK